ncbi:DUF2218 domain-containing protein [Rhizobium sp. BK251]|uniref:DUF2218 domain-containing protein n=1 Tax=Rhizobium sp. BK251 TaxID=2512125 RepID=UPI00104D6A8D|nr:DUF2218 domain-containing protein [Rhizobium sp. BK251]TCL68118.1 NADPH-dependent ferric siderophore reductase [Rhizobium sp. BK251]
MMAESFRTSGIATPVDPRRMLDEVCKHFVEHSQVSRNGDAARLESEIGTADINIVGNSLSIRLSCPTAQMLNAVQNVIAEHLFMFAGEEPFDLSWSDPPPTSRLPDFHEIEVVGARNITPHMRRVTVACASPVSFLDGGLHVRLLIPPTGRVPVWPRRRPDGRIEWPKGDDELAVRIYTIRNVDVGAGTMDIDFVLHEGEGMPGASWAANAKPGDRAGLLGPGGGGVPKASDLILAGDETALPAISRIAAEVPAGTRLKLFIEVDNPSEEQPLPSAGHLDLTWLYRNGAAAGTTRMIEKAVRLAVSTCSSETFVWVGCERAEAKAIRDYLKNGLHRDRQLMSIGAYWER